MISYSKRGVAESVFKGQSVTNVHVDKLEKVCFANERLNQQGGGGERMCSSPKAVKPRKLEEGIRPLFCPLCNIMPWL